MSTFKIIEEKSVQSIFFPKNGDDWFSVFERQLLKNEIFKI